VKPFNVDATCQEAWNYLWAYNLKKRKEGHDWKGDSYYLTATDIERQVRAFAYDDFTGQPRGTHPYGGPIRIYHGGRGSLLQVVRDWLHSQYCSGKLERHNFGRGHISGMRYRPKGAPIGEREKVTIKRNSEPRKPRPHHYGERGALLCRQGMKKRMSWGFNRHPAWTTKNWKEVTCQRCLKHKGVE
jgi:hypothetical protein